PIDSSTPKSIPTPTTTPDLAPMSILSPMPTQAVYALALVIQRTAEFSIQLECNGSNDVTVANQVGPSGEASMDTERDVPFANDPIQTSTTTALTVACTSEFFTQPQCSDGDDASMVSSVVLEVEASINTEGYVMATDSLTATPIPSPVPTLDLATDDWIFIPSGSGCYEERNGTKTAQRLKKLKKRSSKSSLFSLHK
ncbi:hypothetical protein IW150_006598, partial [Coemansia sp. RSA 2607]